MNTQYFQYALEVEKTGSITQAANNLYISQPTMSKAIKDMEDTVGFPIFHRTSRGMVPTVRGKEFLQHARRIAADVQNMEQALRGQDSSRQLFSIAIPRVHYIAEAVAEFLPTFNSRGRMEINVIETNPITVLNSVAEGQAMLGVVRCHAEDREYFLKSIAENRLRHELVWRGNYVALMREDHPLAHKEHLTCTDFLPYVEIAFGDDRVPYVRNSEAKTASGATKNDRRILVTNRAMRMNLLKQNSQAYTWTSPLRGETLQSGHLVQRGCTCDHRCQFEDLLVAKAGYRFSELDIAFINQLSLQRNQVAYPIF